MRCNRGRAITIKANIVDVRAALLWNMLPTTHSNIDVDIVLGPAANIANVSAFSKSKTDKADSHAKIETYILVSPNGMFHFTIQ